MFLRMTAIVVVKSMSLQVGVFSCILVVEFQCATLRKHFAVSLFDNTPSAINLRDIASSEPEFYRTAAFANFQLSQVANMWLGFVRALKSVAPSSPSGTSVRYTKMLHSL